MINHIRTLLFNEKGSNSPGKACPLEEYTPSDFIPSKMSTPCQRAWNTIFGANPDRAYKNWRLYQISQLSEATDLGKLWYRLDNRITHFGRQSIDESGAFDRVKLTKASNGNYVECVESYNGIALDSSRSPRDYEAVSFILSGYLICNESVGSSQSAWLVNVTDSTDLQVTNLTSGVSDYYTLEYYSNLSQIIPMPGTGLSFRLRNVINDSWHIDVIAKPKIDVGVVLANARNISGTDIDYILTGNRPEYVELSDYWHKSSSCAEQLSAIALGLAYKLEEKRLVQ